MLTLPNFSENCLEVQILKLVRDLPQKTFFITVNFVQIATILKEDIEDFILSKISRKSNTQSFKSKYQKDGTILIFTFISKDLPLDQKFSLINVFVKLCQDKK